MPDKKSNYPLGTGTRSAQAVDRYVGARMRLRRKLAGMTQEQLGRAVGITFQQVQKYENGTNRIGASRLYGISGVLGVPVAWFFEGLPAMAVGRPRAAPAGDDELAVFLMQPAAARMVNAFPKLTPPLKQVIAGLVGRIAVLVARTQPRP